MIKLQELEHFTPSELTTCRGGGDKMIIQYPFDDENNYNFDDTKLEFDNGVCQTKQRTYPDETFYVNYNLSINGNRGNGDLTGISYNGATITNGKLDLTGDTNKRVSYNGVTDAINGQKGCVRFRYTPNYSGIPLHARFLFTTYTTGMINKFYLFHYTINGYLYAQVWDNTGTQKLSIFGNFSNAVSGTEYEIEFDWDFDSGNAYLFIDGNMVASKTGLLITRDTTTYFALGEGSYNEGYFDDLQIFSTPQHTSNYIPSLLHPYNYYEGELSIYPKTSFRTDRINSLELTATSNVRIIVLKDSVKYYYDTVNSTWKTSDGSYSQANDISELTNDDVLNQLIEKNTEFKWELVLNSDGNTLVGVDNFKIDYSFAGDLPTINKTVIYGFYYEKGQPVENVTIKVHSYFLIGNLQEHGIVDYETTTDVTGYWEIKFRYGSVSPTKLYWNFNNNIVVTNFLSGYHSFGELTRL